MVQVVEDDSRNTSELARVVSADPALSARLIRVSNSAFYGFPRRLATVREAILVLGFRQVRQIVLGASLMENWGRLPACEGFRVDLFWRHSLVVALAAETGARIAGSVRPEEAFTAGMLHDIGVLAMLAGDAPRLSAVLARARQGAPRIEAERSLFGFDHAQLGAALGEAWNFPPSLMAAAGNHHSGEGDPVSRLVAAGDALALSEGLGYGFETSASNPVFQAEIAGLERAGASFAALSDRARAFVDSVTAPPHGSRSRAA